MDIVIQTDIWPRHRHFVRLDRPKSRKAELWFQKRLRWPFAASPWFWPPFATWDCIMMAVRWTSSALKIYCVRDFVNICPIRDGYFRSTDVKSKRVQLPASQSVRYGDYLPRKPRNFRKAKQLTWCQRWLEFRSHICRRSVCCARLLSKSRFSLAREGW